jgi:hypothetical protein
MCARNLAGSRRSSASALRRASRHSGPDATRGQFCEVATKGFQRVLLGVDLLARTHAEPTEQRKRRAPALERVLKQEAEHDRRYEEEASADEGAGRYTDERKHGRVRGQYSFYVALVLDLSYACGQLVGRAVCVVSNTLAQGGVDLLLARRIGMFANAVTAGGLLWRWFACGGGGDIHRRTCTRIPCRVPDTAASSESKWLTKPRQLVL